MGAGQRVKLEGPGKALCICICREVDEPRLPQLSQEPLRGSRPNHANAVTNQGSSACGVQCGFFPELRRVMKVGGNSAEMAADGDMRLPQRATSWGALSVGKGSSEKERLTVPRCRSDGAFRAGIVLRARGRAACGGCEVVQSELSQAWSASLGSGDDFPAWSATGPQSLPWPCVPGATPLTHTVNRPQVPYRRSASHRFPANDES